MVGQSKRFTEEIKGLIFALIVCFVTCAICKGIETVGTRYGDKHEHFQAKRK